MRVALDVSASVSKFKLEIGATVIAKALCNLNVYNALVLKFVTDNN